MKPQTTCTKTYTDIPFAHRQPSHKGHCRFIHGHNWSFQLTFVASELDECGFVFDFGKLGAVKEFLNQLDHALVLNDTDPLLNIEALDAVLEFTGRNLVTMADCSAEGLAKWALKGADATVKDISGGRCAILRCTVFEDSKNSATYEVVP